MFKVYVMIYNGLCNCYCQISLVSRSPPPQSKYQINRSSVCVSVWWPARLVLNIQRYRSFQMTLLWISSITLLYIGALV